MTTPTTCTTPGCTNPATDRCGGPDGGPQGCGMAHCDHHLYVTHHYGNLCAACHANIDHRQED